MSAILSAPSDIVETKIQLTMSLNLKEKISGAIYGLAIGDALGIGTEFMTKPEAAFRYPGGLKHYSQIYRDSHRSQFKPGEWSLDTEVVLALIQNIGRHGHLDSLSYASDLKTLYSRTTLDLEGHLRWIMEQPDYTIDPCKASMRVWNERGHSDAPNEALGRAFIVALLPGADDAMVTGHVQITHWDPRCICSAVIISRIAAALLHDTPEPSMEELEKICHDIDERTWPYVTKARQGDLEGLDLDDEETYWFTRKTMGAALWALWHTDSPAAALEAIVAEAGDADTNASLAMALVGLKYGFSALPGEEVEGLADRQTLDKAVDTLTAIIEKGNA